MVDLPSVGDIPQAVMVWCAMKCAAEAGDRQLRGNPQPQIDETTAFTMCFTDCITPGLPDFEDGDADDDDD